MRSGTPLRPPKEVCLWGGSPGGVSGGAGIIVVRSQLLCCCPVLLCPSSGVRFVRTVFSGSDDVAEVGWDGESPGTTAVCAGNKDHRPFGIPSEGTEALGGFCRTYTVTTLHLSCIIWLTSQSSGMWLHFQKAPHAGHL